MVGYIQFKNPIQPLDLVQISDRIVWTEQRASNTSAMNYIRRMNGEMQGRLTEIGVHWPIKIMQRTTSLNAPIITTPK